MGQPAAANVSMSGTSAGEVGRQFYVGVALLMTVFSAVAFAPPLFDQTLRREPLPLTPLVAAHAAVSVVWLFLFLLQAGLVAARRTQVHRRVGILGAVLALAFVVLGSLASIEEARRGYDLAGNLDRLPPSPFSTDPRATQLGLLFDFFQFALLVGAALWYRNRPAIHKRLMLIALLGPVSRTPVAHVIGSWLGPQQWAGLLFPFTLALFLLLLPLHDRLTAGRIHPASLWIGGLVFGSNFLFNSAIIGADLWLRFSEWLIT